MFNQYARIPIKNLKNTHALRSLNKLGSFPPRKVGFDIPCIFLLEMLNS